MMTEREKQLEAVLSAATALLEQSLGSDNGYIPSVGFPLTNGLRNAVKACGVELVYQRGRWSVGNT